MHFVALAITLAIASPLASSMTLTTDYYKYCTFYDDNACTVNAGTAVSTANPGCLNEIGRKSVYIQTGKQRDEAHSLLSSPSPDCPCQNACIGDLDTIVGETGPGTCYDFAAEGAKPNSGYDPNVVLAAQSFRWIGVGELPCPGNNC